MRPRTVVVEVPPAPPDELLRWHRRIGGAYPRPETAGELVYASRAQWLTARRAWERAHGRTVRDWYEETSERALAEGGFDEWARVMFWSLPEPDDDPWAWMEGDLLAVEW